MRPRILRVQGADGAVVDLTRAPADRVLVLVTRSGRERAALVSALRAAQAGEATERLVELEGGAPGASVAQLLTMGPPPVAPPLELRSVQEAVVSAAVLAGGVAELPARREELRLRLEELGAAAGDAARLARRCAEVTAQVDSVRAELEESRRRLAELVATRRQLVRARAHACQAELEEQRAALDERVREREEVEAELASARAAVVHLDPEPRFEAADLDSVRGSLEGRRALREQIDALAAEERDAADERGELATAAPRIALLDSIPEEVLGDLLEAGLELLSARESMAVLERAAARERERAYGGAGDDPGDEDDRRAGRVAALEGPLRRELRGRLALLDERRDAVARAREAAGRARVELGALEGGRDRIEREETRRVRTLTVVAGAAGVATLLASGAWALLPGGIALASLGAGLLGRRRGIAPGHGERLEARSRLDALEAELRAAERLHRDAVSHLESLCQEGGFASLEELQGALLDHTRLRALIELESRHDRALGRVAELETSLERELGAHGLLEDFPTGTGAACIAGAIEGVRSHLERRRRLDRLDRESSEREVLRTETEARLARVEADLIEWESRLDAAGISQGEGELSLLERLQRWLTERESIVALRDRGIPVLERRLEAMPPREALEATRSRLAEEAERVSAGGTGEETGSIDPTLLAADPRSLEERLIENRIRQEELAGTLRLRMRELDSRLLPALHAVQAEYEESRRQQERIDALSRELAGVEDTVEEAVEQWLVPVLATLSRWSGRAGSGSLPASDAGWLVRRLEEPALGSGEIDLASVLARIAMAAHLLGDRGGVIVLEDSLTLLDDAAFSQALGLLAAEVSVARQVVLVTAQAARLERIQDSIHSRAI